jgi:two-component system, LytTR family, response regulator LytT
MTNILIIEDEAKAARELEHILGAVNEQCHVLAIIDSVEQALHWLRENKPPDLIFSDVQLADGLSFEIYQKLEVSSPVVFCTAFDEYLMNAFDTNAISYILKPISRSKVEKALEKFMNLRAVFRKDEGQGSLNRLMDHLNYNYKTALLVHQKEKIIPVQVKEIAYFYLDRSSISLMTLARQKFFLSATLDDLEKSLDPAIFYRANRQFIINKAAVQNAERFFARKLVARLMVDTPETVIISKAKSTEFLQWLEGA